MDDFSLTLHHPPPFLFSHPLHLCFSCKLALFPRWRVLAWPVPFFYFLIPLMRPPLFSVSPFQVVSWAGIETCSFWYGVAAPNSLIFSASRWEPTLGFPSGITLWTAFRLSHLIFSPPLFFFSPFWLPCQCMYSPFLKLYPFVFTFSQSLIPFHHMLFRRLSFYPLSFSLIFLFFFHSATIRFALSSLPHVVVGQVFSFLPLLFENPFLSFQPLS